MTVTIQALHAALNKPIDADGNFSNVFIRFLADLVNDRSINAGTAQPVTIASGVISNVSAFSYYSITVETGASDDLDTVNNLNEGDLIFYKAATAGKSVVFKDGTGNIKNAGGADLTLDNTDDLIIGFFDGTSLKCNIWDIS